MTPFIAVPYILRLAWRLDRRRLIVAASLLLGGVVAQPAVALLVRLLSDDLLSVGTAPDGIHIIAVAVMVSLILQLLLSHLAHLFHFELSDLLEREMNRKLAVTLHSGLSLDEAESGQVANDLVLARSDLARMRATLEASLTSIVVLFQLSLTSALFFSVNPFLIVVVFSAAVYVLSTTWCEQPIHAAREQAAVTSRSILHLRRTLTDSDHLKESRLGTASLRINDLHGQAQERHLQTISHGHSVFFWRRTITLLPFVAIMVGALGYTVDLSSRALATPGSVVMVLTLIIQVGLQVSSLVSQVKTVYAASAGLIRVDRSRASSSKEENRPPRRDTPENPNHGDLVLDNVSYRYSGGNRDAIDAVSLRIPAGSAVAIVGENGSGKSTFIRLVQGLCQPTGGSITLGLVDLAHMAPSYWHRKTAALFQDFLHLNATVAESVGIGDVDFLGDNERIDIALKRARAQELVSSVGGLNTYLGNTHRSGRNLSGGQWQSIGLARSLIKDQPLILSLDEPGHSLDPEAELEMVAAYEASARDYAKRGGTISFYVTHRLSSVRRADLVLLLRSGKVAGLAPHDELMGLDEGYRDLYLRQAAAYRYAD